MTTEQFPSYLRLHVEDVPTAPPVVALAAEDALARLCRSFRRATGWQLVHGEGAAPLQSPDVLWARSLTAECDAASHLAIRRTPGKTAAELQNDLLPLCDLLDSIADLSDQLHQTRRTLIEREAELAVGVPLVARSDDDTHLAYRLRAILRGGAQAVGAQAAALYLLDDGTSQLKLRSAWGLPTGRYLEAARPLRGAIADLEALTGHAVAIEDVQMLPHWKVPETFASALCVPVSSPSTPLGTLWIFCDDVRDFSDAQTNMLEIVAGRIAADLERQILLSAANQTGCRQEADGLAELQDAQLPIVPPHVAGWDVAAACRRGDCTGGDFYDWYARGDGSLTLALGCGAASMPAALTMQLVRGAAKSALVSEMPPEKLIRHVAEVVWTSTTGDASAALAAAAIRPVAGGIEFCSAGPLGALIVRRTRPTSISQGAAALGSDPDAVYHGARHKVEEGEVLVLLGDAVRKAANQRGEQLGEAAIADCLRERLAHPAEAMAEAVLELYAGHIADNDAPPAADATVLIARRVATK